MSLQRTLIHLGLVVCTQLPTTSLLGQTPASFDWPQWMGPERNGTAAAEKGTFSASALSGLREVWRRGIGRGYSSVSVVGDRAWTLEETNGRTVVLAMDTHTGADIWRHEIDGEKSSLGPLSTPSIDQDRIFALSPRGKLHALSASTGEPLWNVDLVNTFNASPLSYGFSTSPLVVGNIVVVLAGGSEHNLIAFDKASGSVAWTVDNNAGSSYSSPILMELTGRQQIIVPSGHSIYAVNVDGEVLWSFREFPYPNRSPLPISANRFLIANEESSAVLELNQSATAVREVWRTRQLHDTYSSAVIHEDTLYGFSNDLLVALSPATGDSFWQESLTGGSLILANDHLIVLTQSGELQILQASPEKPAERLRRQVFRQESTSLTSPSFSGCRIFLRNQKDILAMEIGTEQAAALESKQE